MTATTLPLSAPLRLTVDDILSDLDLLKHNHIIIDDDEHDHHDDQDAQEQHTLALLTAFDPATNEMRTSLQLIRAFLSTRARLAQYSSSPSSSSSTSAKAQSSSLQLDSLHARVADMQTEVDHRERDWVGALHALGVAQGRSEEEQQDGDGSSGVLAHFQQLGRTPPLDLDAAEEYNTTTAAAHDQSRALHQSTPSSSRPRPAWDDGWQEETLAPLPLPRELLPTDARGSSLIARSDQALSPSPSPSPSSPNPSFLSTASPSSSSLRVVSSSSLLAPIEDDGGDDDDAEDAWALGEEEEVEGDAQQVATGGVDVVAVEQEEDEDAADAWALGEEEVEGNEAAAVDAALSIHNQQRPSSHAAPAPTAAAMAPLVEAQDDDAWALGSDAHETTPATPSKAASPPLPESIGVPGAEVEDDAWDLDAETHSVAAAAGQAQAQAVDRAPTPPAQTPRPPPAEAPTPSGPTTGTSFVPLPGQLEEDEEDAWALESEAHGTALAARPQTPERAPASVQPETQTSTPASASKTSAHLAQVPVVELDEDDAWAFE
ncbi:hypothetical protein V8E36_009382 [Tilletia maclaganii]